MDDDTTVVINAEYLYLQREWSERTFGPGERTQGIIDHLRKELIELEANPQDIFEWADIIILAFDGVWRAGFSPDLILDAIAMKQRINEQRKWPNWRTAEPGKAIEHVRD